MTWAHNGGRGAYLCQNCRTMICEDVGVYAPYDDARTAHRLSAVVGKSCGRIFCSPRCAAAYALGGWRAVADFMVAQEVEP